VHQLVYKDFDSIKMHGKTVKKKNEKNNDKQSLISTSKQQLKRKQKLKIFH